MKKMFIAVAIITLAGVAVFIAIQNSQSPRQPAAPPSAIQQDYYPSDQLAFAGYAQPELALRSMMWASHQQNLSEMSKAMSPAMSEVMKKSFANLPPDVVDRIKLIKGYRILEMKVQSNDKVEFRTAMVKVDGTEIPEDAVFRRYGNEWKASLPDE